MELKTYLLILLKKWWIVLSIFLITLTTAIVIIFTTSPVYSATATFVVAPASSFDDVRSYATGLNILSNREEIVATYTEVATSRNIKKEAAELIGLESTRGYSIESDLVKGSNVMKITVTGPDPETVSNLANSVGSVLVDYVADLYGIYQLSPLDEAVTPEFPIRPDKVRDIGLAAVLGLVLGASVAFLVSYLDAPLDSIVNVNIIDSVTGVYNKQYFLQRLTEEMVRSKTNRYPLSLSLMRVDNLDTIRGFNASKVRNEALRYVGVLARDYLREEDLVAYLGNDIFGFLLPDIPGQQAQHLIEYLQSRIKWAPFQSKIVNLSLNLGGTAGITAYDSNGTGRDQLLNTAIEALQLAEVSENGKAYLKTSDLSE